MSQGEVAAYLGVSRFAVWEVEQRAIAKLRAALEDLRDE